MGILKDTVRGRDETAAEHGLSKIDSSALLGKLKPAEDDVVRGLNTGNGTGPHKYCPRRDRPSHPEQTTPLHLPLTPRLPSSAVKHIKESLALLELDFVEFRELTLARLTEASPTQQLRDEVAQMKRENRAAVNGLRAELKGLQ
ncbi:UNVERIFIED_CONTAM: hypothetical protein FKN15_040731 [Acipenser sinensis]